MPLAQLREKTPAHVFKMEPTNVNKLYCVHCTSVNYFFRIITLMIIENRALWLARSLASSRYNHRAVIITLKASSFQNGSLICWCFGVGNWSIILFSRIIINGNTSTSSWWLFTDIHVAFGKYLLNNKM